MVSYAFHSWNLQNFRSCCANLLSSTSEKHQHLLLLQTWASKLHHVGSQHSFKQPPLTGFGSKHFPLVCWQLRTPGLIRPFPQARLDGRYQSELQHLKLGSPRISMYIMTDSRDFRGEIAFQLCEIQSFENCMFFYSYSKHGLDVSCLITPRQSHFAISPGIKEGRVFPRAAEETSFHRLAQCGPSGQAKQMGKSGTTQLPQQIFQQWIWTSRVKTVKTEISKTLHQSYHVETSPLSHLLRCSATPFPKTLAQFTTPVLTSSAVGFTSCTAFVLPRSEFCLIAFQPKWLTH